MDELDPVVIDCGSDSIKAGFGGDEKPSLIFPSAIGRKNSDANSRIGLTASANYTYPIEYGVIKDFDCIRRIWDYTFSQLNCRSSERKVMLTETLFNTKQAREMTAQIMFEENNVPSLLIALQGLLSLYSVGGRLTGVMVELGDMSTQLVPIYEGYAIPAAFQKVNMGGRDLTKNLLELLNKQNYQPENGTLDFNQAKLLKEQYCSVASCREELEAKLAEPGNGLGLGGARYQCSEALFKPELIGLDETAGLHQLIYNVVNKCDMNMRRELYERIQLSGGTSMLEGLNTRVLNELTGLTPSGLKLKVVAPNTRNYSAWIGGSVLSIMSTFNDNWIKRSEYEERGAAVIHKNSF